MKAKKPILKAPVKLVPHTFTPKVPNYNGVIFNPSIIKSGSNWIISYRIWLDNMGPKVHPWKSIWRGTNKLGLALLDSKFKIIKTKLINEDIEDIRLFKSNGKIKMIFTKYLTKPEKIRKYTSGDNPTPYKVITDPNSFMMYTSTLKPSLEKSQNSLFCSGHTTQQEKNWVPLPGNKVMRFSYKNPGKISIYNTKDFITCDNQIHLEYTIKGIEELSKISSGSLRFSGGSPAISFNSNEYIAIGHLVIKARNDLSSIDSSYTKVSQKYKNTHYNGLVYLNYFYTISKTTLKVIRISKPFGFTNHAIEFPVGLVKSGKYLIVSYGINDSQVKITKIPTKMLKLYPESQLPTLNAFRLK